jgi:tRNA A-37 threonylcarbamoyl transferase component Bud32
MRAATTRRKWLVHREFELWRSCTDRILAVGRRGYAQPVDRLGVSAVQSLTVTEHGGSGERVHLAVVDQDGYLLSRFGPLAHARTTSESEFRPRDKCDVKVVSAGGILAIEKSFRGNRLRFLNEVKALHVLGENGCHVPAVLDVDFDALSITLSYISGVVLQEAIVRNGASIDGRDTLRDPRFLALDSRERWLHKVRAGRQHVASVVDRQFVQRLKGQFMQIHECGFLVNDVKFGNIILEESTGQPFLIDFDLALDCRNVPRPLRRSMQKRELAKLRLHFPEELFE